MDYDVIVVAGSSIIYVGIRVISEDTRFRFNIHCIYYFDTYIIGGIISLQQ